MSLFLPAQRTNSPYTISCLCPFKREPRLRCPSSCRPSRQTAYTPSHASVPLSYLELPDENLVYDVPLLAGPADKQPPYTISCLCPFKLPDAPGREPRLRCPSSCRPSRLTANTPSHASVPLSYLELPDENLVYDVPLLAGPADKEAFTLHPWRQFQVRQHLYKEIKKAGVSDLIKAQEFDNFVDFCFFHRRNIR
jgi:hypothetical protein